jgi:integrase
MGGLTELIGKGRAGEHVIQWRHPSTISHKFRACADAAGYPGVRLYDCRHTFGTILVAEGVDLFAVQTLMGHKDLATTKRYVHVGRAHLENAASKLNGIFGGPDKSMTASAQVVELKRAAE